MMNGGKMSDFFGSDVAKFRYDLLRPLAQENDLILVDNDRK